MKSAGLLCLFFLLLVSRSACAWDVLGIQPALPAENQWVSVVMGTGGCDAFPSTEGFPQINQTGQNIRILFFGVRATDPEFCNFLPGQYAYPVGHCLVGNYVLTIDVLYEHFPFGFEIVTLATIPFNVSRPPAALPTAVPALNATGAQLLCALVALIASMAYRRRGSTREKGAEELFV